MNRFSRVFLVALRIAIGWHFLYEGLYKIDSNTGATMYVAARYPTQAATGRLRDYLEQAGAAVTLAEAGPRIDAWNEEIVKVFKGRQPLSEDQKARLTELGDRLKLAVARRERSGGELMNFDWTNVHEETLKLANEPEGERFTALGYLQGSSGPLRPLFRALVSDVDGVERLTAASARARLDRRFEEILRHFQEYGQPFSEKQARQLADVRDLLKKSVSAAVDSPAFQTRLADYKAMRERVGREEGQITTPFSRERVDADRKKLDLIAGEMLAFVNEPLSELAVQMQGIATPLQLGAGPLRRPEGPADFVDVAIQVSLTAIGVCLMLGLFTPVAALAAAGQLAMFYFAAPPWPGLPAAAVAGHYLYIDRNFIEALGALVIATTGTGEWAGLDFYVSRYLLPRLRRQPRPEPEMIPELATRS
jgi:uncharacterized membrane protein YphA (DoxX/SURF4 family)